MKTGALRVAAMPLHPGWFGILAFGGNSARPTTITGSEVWTAADNPHIVTENLTIASGGSLTIESGSLVKLSSNVLISVNDGGVWDATGATFTWADGVNEWRGIYFSSPDSRNRLVNCTIEHAKGYSHTNPSLFQQ